MRRPLLGLVLVGALGLGSFTSFTEAATREGSTPWALEQALKGTAELSAPRAPGTQDRYAPARGCFALRSAQTGRLVTRTADGFAATGTRGEAFRFQTMDLGKYLLYGSKKDFLATAANPLPLREVGATVKSQLDGTGDEHLEPVREPLKGAVDAVVAGAEPAAAPVVAGVRGDGIEAAASPSASAEWVLKTVGRSFVLQQAFDDGDIADPGPLEPRIAATLVSSNAGALTAASGSQTGRAAQFSLVKTGGCAAWPTAPTSITGPTIGGATSYSQSRGYVDAHVHMMAFEFLGGRIRCGRPFHPYGISYALVDCADHAPGGYGAVMEDILSGHNPGSGHDTVGWPSFKSWPDNDSLLHEAMYYQWLERAWRGGLRMFTNLLVDNEQGCEAYPLKKNSCNEMDGVRLEAKRIRELERYIDAENGGPGRGWFRIVTDPLQARAVMNSGRLAVVLGIEVSRPLNCRELMGMPSCTKADIDRGLTEVYKLGVRQMEMTNKYDNALTGVKGDEHNNGVLINSLNRNETGHYWKMETCKSPFGPVRADETQHNIGENAGDEVGRDAIFGAVAELAGTSGVAPVYPVGPHCNIIGLSDLGKAFLDGMMKRGMIFDPDHMSAIARTQALDILARRGYSGVLSSHSWADDDNYYRILKMGGIVTPHAGGTAGFLGKWQKLRRKADPRFLYGIGWGSDINGLSHQGGPRNPAAGKGVPYPFKGLGGITVDKGRSGTRVWDINLHGVDTYGQYVDWVEDLRILAGKDGGAVRRDLENGVEAMLQMWERANGVRGDSCRSDIPDVTATDLKRLRTGMTPGQVLAVLGQPHSRVGTAFGYCGTRGTVTISFTRAGALTKVA
jgi:hypothetical protein